jgi:hypothetical protein
MWSGAANLTDTEVMFMVEQSETREYLILWYLFGEGMWDCILFDEVLPHEWLDTPAQYGELLLIQCQ